MEEIEPRDKDGDAWVIVHGQVYDGTKVFEKSPFLIGIYVTEMI
jgi:hypothetical protein